MYELSRDCSKAVKGSVWDVAESAGQSLADAFMNVTTVVLFDRSGSMDNHDGPGGRMRWTVAVDELEKLQAANPGQVGLVQFDDTAEFVPGGVPDMPRGGTDLAGALDYVKRMDGLVSFVVVSDGYPDSPTDALYAASSFTSRIDCVYVGPEHDARAAEFMRKLAGEHGGVYVKTALDQLSSTVGRLMLEDKNAPKAGR